MKRNVYWAINLRRPLVTLLLFVFIGAVAFAFVGRAAEYIIVSRETERIGTYYRSIGTILSLDPVQEYDEVTAGADLIGKSTYLDYEDRRRANLGFLQGLYNADVDGHSSDYYGKIIPRGVTVSDVWVYGTLTKKEFSSDLFDGYPPASSPENTKGYLLTVMIDRVAAGYPEYVGEGKARTFKYFLTGAENEKSMLDGLEEGRRYLFRAYYDPFYVPGRGGVSLAHRALVAKPLDDADLWYLPVKPGEDADFDDPALAEVKNLLDVTRENQSAMTVIATKDMTAMPDFQEEARSYLLAEGRWLDRSDDLNERKVCVVHSEFASMRGFQLGDMLTLTLRDLPTYDIGGYISSEENKAAWRKSPTATLVLEIVGIYEKLQENPNTSSSRIMYIPDSCLPVSYGSYGYAPLNTYSYSFVLNSSRDQDAFLAENEEALHTLGFNISFLNSGAEAYWSSVEPLQQSTLANAVVFAVVLSLASVLAVALNFYRGQREFAIQRALGIPKRKAALQFMAPMTAMGILGVGTGGALAWRFTLEKAADTLSSIQRPEGIETSAALPVAWLVLLCAGIFGLLVLFTALSAWIVARRPVLELLQGVAKRNPQNDHTQAGSERVQAPIIAAAKKGTEAYAPASAGVPAPHMGGRFAASARYVLRHIGRSAVKSVLITVVALCFMLALGWLNRTIARNEAQVDHQYATVVVEAEITVKDITSSFGPNGMIFLDTIEAIMDTGYIQSYVLEGMAPRMAIAPIDKRVSARKPWDEERQYRSAYEGFALYGIENAEAFFAGSGRNVTLEYSKGYGVELFAEEWTPQRLYAGDRPRLLLPPHIMEAIGVTYGDVVYLLDERQSGMPTECIVAGEYDGQVICDGGSDTILLSLSALKAMENTSSRTLSYAAARFSIDPAKNRELDTFREEMKAIVEASRAGRTELRCIFWDEELKQVVEPLEKNLRLMAVLYPVTVAVSVLIAAGLSLLMVLQTAKEAAIMRVLGATRRKVRAMLGAEQLLLCWFGITLGVAALALTREGAAPITLAYFIYAALYFAGSVFGAVLGVILITNRMPLEMLQVKE